jgi:hypothetical protein
MGEAQAVSALIGDIYDAALDPARWPDALRQVARFVGGPSAGLLSKDATRKSGNIFYSDGGIEPHYVRLYFDSYVKLDPLNTAHFFAEIDQPVSIADIMPVAEFHETRFWKEWAQPQGLVDYVSVALDKTATSAAMLGIFRHERDGVVDDAVRRRVCLLAPHMRRAVLIGRVIDLRTAEAASFADTLDGIAAHRARQCGRAQDARRRRRPARIGGLARCRCSAGRPDPARDFRRGRQRRRGDRRQGHRRAAGRAQ